MNPYREQICAYIDAHRNEMIEKWRDFVNVEGRFTEKEDVEKAQDWFQAELEANGFRTWTVPAANDRCGMLLGVLGEERGTAPILFAGHLDTVFSKGAFGCENPFRIEGNKAYGPGVIDMKGGLIMALYIVKALESIGYQDHPFKFAVCGDEEGDHIGNDIDKVFLDESKGALCAFNMETGNPENNLTVGRKGIYTLHATIHGLGGHAGSFFTQGHNALNEAAMKIVELIKVTDLEKGTTVTPSVLHCGKNTSSIPDTVEMAVDTRVLNDEEGARVLREFDAIMKKSYVAGTTADYHVDIAKLYAFAPNEGIMKLLEHVNKVAAENGFKTFGQQIAGGASDTGAIVKAGVPALCSCGVAGTGAHTLGETADVESLFERAKIFSLAITEVDKLF